MHHSLPPALWRSLQETLLTTAHLYGRIPEGFQPLSAALLHVNHIPVVSLQRPLKAVHRLEHQVLTLVQLLLENFQSVNLNADRDKSQPLNCKTRDSILFSWSPCVWSLFWNTRWQVKMVRRVISLRKIIPFIWLVMFYSDFIMKKSFKLPCLWP